MCCHGIPIQRSRRARWYASTSRCMHPAVPENDAVIPTVFNASPPKRFPHTSRVLGTKASEIIQPTSSTHSTPLCVHLIAELTHYHLSFSNTPPLEEVPAGRLVYTAPLKLASLLARPAHSVPCWKLSTSVIVDLGTLTCIVVL